VALRSMPRVLHVMITLVMASRGGAAVHMQDERVNMTDVQLDAHYWGPMDAMHQFCEAKYAVSPYMAEFWNAFSNLPFFILPGIYSLCRGHAVQDARVAAIWLSMITVGIGSFMFHGTMRFKWEMLDELPMVVLVLCCAFSKDDTHWLTRGICKHLIHFVFCSVSFIGMYMYISQGSYEIFLHTFTLIILLDLVLALVCTSKPDKHGSHVARGLMWAYIFTISFGKMLWEIEARLCPAGTGGFLALLHVLWHLFAGLACYLGTLSNIHSRYMHLGVDAAVDEPGSRWPLVGLLGVVWLRPAGKRD